MSDRTQTDRDEFIAEDILSVGTDEAPEEETEIVQPEEGERAENVKKGKLARIIAFIKDNISSGIVDRPMVVIIMLLIAFGSVMVFSASYAYAYSSTGDSAFYIKKQLFWVALGTVAMIIASYPKVRIYKLFTVPLFAVSMMLLLVVLVFGMAAGVAQRWISIAGISFQPSELMKLALILLLGWYGERFAKKVEDPITHKKSFLYSVIFPAAIIGMVCVFVLLENHLSGTIILFLIGVTCMWAIGADKKWFILLGAIGGTVVAAVLFIVWFKDASWNKIDDLMPAYVVKRIDMWIRPENYTVLDDTWQTVQGTIAVGSGGFFGTGFGKSFQKHLFVSQPQNDFIFAIICEELGFVGAVALMLLYIAFIYRGLQIVKNASDAYSSIVAMGIVGHVGIQAFLNMMVVTAILPNTGISLPFISYGGSSLVMLMAEMGVLLGISRRAKLQK